MSGEARRVLVTGASAGIGRACAEGLHTAGWAVTGASRRGTTSGRWAGLVMDVDDDDSVRAGVAGLLADGGRIDALVACAGWGLAGAVEQCTIAEAKAQLETNFWGCVRVLQQALPAMREQGSGRIVLMSSIGGLIGIPFQAFYSASKFALEGLGEALAYEVAPLGVHVTLVEPGSCFVGTLAELVFAADRSYMLIGSRQGDNRAPPTIELSAMNFGPYPMSHGLTRLQSRVQADAEDVLRAQNSIGAALDAEQAEALGLVTFAVDDIDWDDEIRVFFEERTSFSPDSLTGSEANLRFVGPETMESKIFSRLTAWQNWIFQRPNAVGEAGALRRYGTGQKAQFDMTRV